MNGLQIATWIILAATFIIQGYTFWLMRKTAKIRKQRAQTRVYVSNNTGIDRAAVAQEIARQMARGER
jgi:hypothetical protein